MATDKILIVTASLSLITLTLTIDGSFASGRYGGSAATYCLFVRSFRYNSSLRLPDVVSVMEYFVQIQPYYPAPEVHYNDSRNMTFDGFVLMSMVVKKPTNVITLNALNIDVSDLHLKDLLQNEIRVKERSKLIDLS
ncbi:hypothetical protein NECAME_00559 [Necator americanus]|uniref:Uncharacterized protein n=1 Tax=Necator americanus TaxID=51031 RepID=W2SZR9_NECAM|nr:hypothetical protein NECAME_00559 [Necator americanus]ETN75148.1 hypothetical protein NECAME_00559 [Necator americanus]